MQDQNSSSTQGGCTMCPRACHVDRSGGDRGVCRMPSDICVSRIAPHMWEEPPISGTRGSGTIFFSGCNLGCIYCQNRRISRTERGTPISEEALAARMLDLAADGVHNINLVTPTHYSDALARVIRAIRPRLGIPVVWNSGGYESVETLRSLEGLVDIYLPDFKYASEELAAAYSGAPDYPLRAADALREMYRQIGPVVFDGDGLMVRGLLVRHLVLPGHRKESIKTLEVLADLLPLGDIRVSIMRQYTPDFAMDTPYPNLRRRVTDFEYESVLDAADRLGIVGYRQGKDAADRAFTPDF
ncbi:MAG: radical SAM protein [Clostridia bacterium]|nr:radical SAM protein [Clostridia bacterium]